MILGKFEEISSHASDPRELFKEIISLSSYKGRPGETIFRGESKTFESLIPTIGRMQISDYATISDEDYEISLFKEYLRKSDSSQKLDYPGILINKLIEAQLHGLYTRLLDWSENALVAMYFVVSQHEKEDGVLWVLKTGPFTDSTKLFSDSIGSIFSIHQDGTLIREALSTLEMRRLFAGWDGIGLVTPPYTHPRVISQQSILTFHSLPALNFLDYFSKEDPSFDNSLFMTLKRFKIKAEFKIHLRRILNSLNINHYTMFPDLGGLSKHLNWFYTKDKLSC